MSSPQYSDNEEPNSFDEEEEKVTKLKSALWLPIGQMVDRTTINMGKNATPQFIGALTELVWHQIETVACDVESFARHAGRTTVTTEDVLLIARRNEDLTAILRDHLSKTKDEGSTKKKQKK